MPDLLLARPLRVLLLLLGLTTLLSVAHLPPAGAATEGRLLLLLDSSGSMGGKIRGGTKIAAAKKALNTVVDRLPSDAQVGLRVYGAKIKDENNPAACTDSELVVPIGTVDKVALKDQVARYRPLGVTPIAYSLEQAAKDVGGSGRRTVVLVSDGKESCGADPCATAANLAKQGIDLKFDVIGLSVSGSARSQLQCIADKGHGTYDDADNAQQIEDSLDQLATRAFQPFQLSGTPVEGSEDEAQATRIGPGQYVDHVPGRTQRKIWYRMDRTQPGSTFHVGLTARSTSANSAFNVHIEAPDGTYCGWGYAAGHQGLVAGGTSSWSSNPTSACNTADHVLAYVDASLADLLGAQFEMVVTEEPALASDRNLPPIEKPTWQNFSLSKPVAAPVPGLSLSDAPALTAGSYSGSILTGETQVFAVDLDWGQQLEVEMQVPERRGALAKALSAPHSVNLQLLGAGRGQYLTARATDQPKDSISFDTDGAPYATFATTGEIRFLNRSPSLLGLEPGAIPGRQYIAVSLNRFSSERAFLVPYVLGVSVVGTAGAGAPEYAANGAAVSPTPSGTSSPSPVPSSSDATSPPAQSTSSSVGVPLLTAIGIGVGALVLGAAGAAAALVVRRRRRG